MAVWRTTKQAFTELRALIVEEQTERGNLEAGQRDVLLATEGGSVRSWLKENTEDGPNKGPGFRFLDKDAGTDRDAEWVGKLRAVVRDGDLPFLVAVHGRRAWIGPLPPDREKTLAVLEKVRAAK